VARGDIRALESVPPNVPSTEHFGRTARQACNDGAVVGAAATAGAARRMWDKMDPDAVVLDIDLGPGVNGFDLADAFLAQRPGLAVLFLSNLPDARFAGRDAGSLPPGVGYVRKDQLANTLALVTALDAVLRGLADQTPRHDRDPSRPLAHLSRTQIEVLRLVAMGLSNEQIAAERGTTTRAVHNVLSRAMATIGEVETEEGSARVAAAREFIRAAGLPERG
jgi:DNA-binding NarL/FixJ family response regulator